MKQSGTKIIVFSHKNQSIDKVTQIVFMHKTFVPSLIIKYVKLLTYNYPHISNMS